MTVTAIPRVLTIGGSDSSGAAGIQSDLKTFEAHGVYGVSALTVITAQNSLGIKSTRTMDADFVTEQIEAVQELGISSIKKGLLLSEEILVAVSRALHTLNWSLIADSLVVFGGGRRLSN